VAAVVAYHLNVPHASGGLLGVGIFFTLSGYLITSILLRSYRKTGTMGFKNFWLHRARRLLPALVCVLVVVLVVSAIANPSAFHQRFIQGLGALFYVNNWVVIHQGVSYFARFGAAGPFDHLWSLSVEEQFYVVWPILLFGLVSLTGGKLRRVAWITGGFAIVSFILLWVFSHPGFDNTRPYEGTDTRAGALLVGALLAMVWRPNRVTKTITLGARIFLNALAVLALVVMAQQIISTDQYSLSIYHSGLLWLSLATALLVAVVLHPGSDANRVIGIAPLRWVGERSYGIYLWQLPLTLAFPKSFLADQPVIRDIIIIAVILAVSSLSWNFLEDPIRRLGFRDGLAQLVAMARHARKSKRSPLAVLVAGAVIALAIGGIALLSHHTTVVIPPTTTTANPNLPTTTIPQRFATQTDCRVVVYDGDSTSEGLVSTDYLPNPADRIDARLKDLGTTTFYNEISGAQSVNELWNNQPNAQMRTSTLLRQGVRGCWIFALGTNDAADVAVGSHMGVAARIAAMMHLVNGQPTMWVTLKTLSAAASPYADPHMQAMNQDLIAACRIYPNMRVYNWRSEVQDNWYQSDDIHFTSAGYAQRSTRIAHALANAFPLHTASPPGCLVSSGLPG
jgi:hypothetical protein